MKKQGFTLMELLAVVIILGLLALIVTPLITKVVSNLRKHSAVSSTYGYVSAVENAVLSKSLKGINLKGTYTYDELKEYVDTKGTAVSKGTISINTDGEVETASLCVNNYRIDYSNEKAVVNVDNDCNTIGVQTTIANGTAVYFNPVTGTTCQSSEVVSINENKTGCMRWYVFNDKESNSTVDMILDHNTTAHVAWNTTETTGPVEVLTQLKSDTSSWAGVETRTDSYTSPTASYTIDYSTYKARLITANELAKITGNTSFGEATTTSSVYYFFGTNTDLTEYENESWYINNEPWPASIVALQNKYAWLFDYTYQCTVLGCNNEDNIIYTSDNPAINDNPIIGYWTASTTANNSNLPWTVIRGSIDGTWWEDITHFGVRPVITIPKSIIK